MQTLSTKSIPMKPFLNISKIHIPNVYVAIIHLCVHTPLEKHFNTQTKILQAEQLCSLGFYPEAGTLNSW